MAFYDDSNIPSVLVQNKVDLLPPEEQDNIDELKQFSDNNGFNGCFRTSAITGKNIAESMEFLIEEIIKRLEEMYSKGNDSYKQDRQSQALDPERHSKAADQKRKREGCCK